MRINRVYLTEKKYSFLEIQHDNLKFIKSQQRYFHVQRLKKASIKYSTNFHLYQKNVSWYHGYNRYYGTFFVYEMNQYCHFMSKYCFLTISLI